MPALRTTSLLSVKAASVKAGEVVLPVMTAVGEWSEISATPATWDALIREITAARKRHVRGPRIGQTPHAKAPITKPGTGRIL